MIFMCSTYVPFEIKPEELAAKGREWSEPRFVYNQLRNFDI